jgi:hypothetical protein
MSSHDRFPDLHQVLPEHATDFCAYLLDLAKDESFIETIEQFGDFDVELAGRQASSANLPPAIRHMLTKLPRAQTGAIDDISVALRVEYPHASPLRISQLLLAHEDSVNQVVLSRVDDAFVSIVDYEESGEARRTLMPFTELEDTLLSVLFDEQPDDLDETKWQHIISYFEQAAPIKERAFKLERLIDAYRVTLRLIEKESVDDSVVCVEFSIFDTASDDNAGLRFSITELGTTSRLIAHSSTVKAAIHAGDHLHYAAAVDAIDSSNHTTPHIPTEEQIGLFEQYLEELIRTYKADIQAQ